MRGNEEDKLGRSFVEPQQSPFLHVSDTYDTLQVKLSTARERGRERARDTSPLCPLTTAARGCPLLSMCTIDDEAGTVWARPSTVSAVKPHQSLFSYLLQTTSQNGPSWSFFFFFPPFGNETRQEGVSKSATRYDSTFRFEVTVLFIDGVQAGHILRTASG